MPYKERKVQKLYYSIGEVAKMYDVNTSLIRFWEKEFDILKPKKNKKGNRLFTNEDLKNIKVIFSLVKEKGYTLEGAKKKLKEGDAMEQQRQKRLEIFERLSSIKKQLKEIEQQL